MADFQPSFASKGVAGTALGLGAGALGIELLRGGFGGLFNGGASAPAAAAIGMDTGMLLDRIGNHEGSNVKHHSLAQSEQLSQARAELAAVRAERYADAQALTAERERGVLAVRIASLEADVRLGREINDLEHKRIREWVKATYVPGAMVMPASSVVALTTLPETP